MNTLLIMSVGGTPDPLVASLLAAQPARVLFVPSPETRPAIDTVLAGAAAQGLALSPGQWQAVEVADSQDFQGCVRVMKGADQEVRQWLARGPEYQVRVDFTAGTKCMSAALALVARRWRCEFVYVGGSERTKGGVGIVVSGREQVVQSQNPWDALGYQAVEDAILLFDQRHYSGAGQILAPARDGAGPEVKRMLSTVFELAEAYEAWDRFRHAAALAHLENVAKNANDLRYLLGASADALLVHLERHRGWLREVGSAGEGSIPQVLDIIANACRRGQESRYDDAVARLYRAIEALAQAALRERHEIPDTGAVPLDRIPPPLWELWRGRAPDGTLMLGLQDDYALLAVLGDVLGARFRDLKLDQRERSPLVQRNQSIFAHGFRTVPVGVFLQLKEATLHLAGVAERDLPAFPRLGE